MRLTTSTFDELLNHVNAYVGGSFGNVEKGFVKSLANRAARRIYNQTQYWPRFLVVGEPRTYSRGYISYTEDSFHVYGAGTSFVNGLYTRDGDENGKPKYVKSDTDGQLVKLSWDGTEWDLTALDYITVDGVRVTVNGAFLVAPGDILYDNTDTGNTPPLTGWVSVSGTAPAPLLVDVLDIDEIIRVHRGTPYQEGIGRAEYFTFPDSKGTRGVNVPPGTGTVYVTYKASLKDTYGDGTGGTVSDIPDEWFDYMAIYAARGLMVSQRQGNENPAYPIIAQSEVDNAMYDALERIDRQHIFNTLGKRVITHTNTNTQL